MPAHAEAAKPPPAHMRTPPPGQGAPPNGDEMFEAMERKAPPPRAQAADAGAQKPAVAAVGGAPGSGMQNAQDSDDCPAQE